MIDIWRKSAARSVPTRQTESWITLVEISFDNPSTSAISRPFRISSDLAADLRDSITQIHLAFCYQLGTSIGRLFCWIDLADGAAPEANALNLRIPCWMRAEMAN
jgi:hypothetical protein